MKPLVKNLDLESIETDSSREFFSIPCISEDDEKVMLTFVLGEDERIDDKTLSVGDPIDYSDFPDSILIPTEEGYVYYFVGSGEL